MKPRALDLFCGAGGASVGLAQAGFDVTGVDVEPQPHYPFDVIREDAMTVSLAGFDFIWASPPCQFYSAFSKGLGTANRYPALIEPIRARLRSQPVPWTIENVPGARDFLESPTMLCGTMFGLRLRRHRLFETSFLMLQPNACRHDGSMVPVYGRTTPLYYHRKGLHFTQADRRSAMGIDWMNRDELAQAIPPAYAEYVGRAALEALKHR